MNGIDPINWLKDAATNLLLLQHTEEDPRFFRNIDAFKAKQASLDRINAYMVLDEPRGSITGQMNDNIRDYPQLAFSILKFVELDDFESEDLAYDSCRRIAIKIMGLAYKERTDYEGLFKNVNIDTIQYAKDGPVLKNWFGCHCQFSVSDTINGEIAYNPADWIP